MLQDFFGEYYNIIGGVSLGTIALVFWRIMAFFKKDKYLLPFVNIAKTKATESDLYLPGNRHRMMKIPEIIPDALRRHGARLFR